MPFVRTVPFVLATLAAAPALAHDEPIVIGRDAADPARLIFTGPEDILDGSEPLSLPPGDGLFEGMWAHDEPSFLTLIADGPDMLRLLPGHAVALRLVAADDAVRFFEPAGFTPILTTPGSRFAFPVDPNGDFEIHLIGAAVLPGLHSATLQLTDLSGQHLDSDPFTIHFQTVPTSASVAPLVIAGLAAGRRRRPT
jgi:hypothetical protein